MAQTNRNSFEVFRGGRALMPDDSTQGKGKTELILVGETDDASAKTIYSHPVKEDSAVYISGYAIGVVSDGSAAVRHSIDHAFRRASGNVTAVGVATSVNVKDAVGSPILAFAANTVTQSIDVSVTGEATTDYIWQVELAIREVEI